VSRRAVLFAAQVSGFARARHVEVSVCDHASFDRVLCYSRERDHLDYLFSAHCSVRDSVGVGVVLHLPDSEAARERNNGVNM